MCLKLSWGFISIANAQLPDLPSSSRAMYQNRCNAYRTFLSNLLEFNAATIYIVVVLFNFVDEEANRILVYKKLVCNLCRILCLYHVHVTRREVTSESYQTCKPFRTINLQDINIPFPCFATVAMHSWQWHPIPSPPENPTSQPRIHTSINSGTTAPSVKGPSSSSAARRPSIRAQAKSPIRVIPCGRPKTWWSVQSKR